MQTFEVALQPAAPNKGDNCYCSTSPARHNEILAATGSLTTENTLQQVTPAYTSSEAPGAEESGSAADAGHDHRPDDIDCSLQSSWDSILQRPVDATPRVPRDLTHGPPSMGGFHSFQECQALWNRQRLPFRQNRSTNISSPIISSTYRPSPHAPRSDVSAAVQCFPGWSIGHRQCMASRISEASTQL
jgi:hypothetical protein